MLDGQAHVYSVYKHTSSRVQGKKQNEIPDRDTRKKKRNSVSTRDRFVTAPSFRPLIPVYFFPGSKPTCDFLTPLHYTAEKNV